MKRLEAGGAPLKGTPRPELMMSLQFADAQDRALLPRHKVARWVRAALESPAEVTVRIVGADAGRALNRDFRGQDHATNVLTFDYQRTPYVLADVVVCAPVVRREALRRGLDLQAHYAHLVVHGTLHAQGHDHLVAAQARSMQALESRILMELGFADPYAPTRATRASRRSAQREVPR